MRTFTAAFQGDSPADAQLAAAAGPVQPISGIGEHVLNAAESRARYFSAREAIETLQLMGANGIRSAQYLRGIITQAVGIGDIGAVRLVSLSTEVSKLYNTDTVFYNLIEDRRLNTVTDFTHGWREDDFGPNTLASMTFDPNGTPAEDDGAQYRRTNTLSAIGKLVNVGIVSNEMIKKRGFMDELDRQVSDGLVKLKRASNLSLLSGTENPNGPIFSMGGFWTRSVNNVVTPGGGAAALNLSDLDTVIADIITAIGVHELVITTASTSAVGVINAQLAKQFPGSRVADFGLSTKPKARVATVYYSPLVGPIPVYLDTQATAGTLGVFAPEYVRPNGFTIGDVAGPWVIALAQTGLSEPKVVFDLLTLEDRVLNSRGQVTNIL